ncbi:DUF3502 domain-containing protein [Clostridium prolinivorans]|uniref:DUF3502 domain-containing protein n=1 Tax=Clostridium prolinivorans TaxID=2769420 RepID=UPI000FDADB83|nr:DUF3502 domain-containing protein [Clostridium prolinivorans]
MKKKIRIKKCIASLLVLSMSLGTLIGCSKKEDTGASTNGKKVDTSKKVNLVMYLWGNQSPDHENVMAELNKKLTEKINATLEIKYIPWDAISTKYPLVFASGENYDMIYVSSAANPNYFSLAEKNSFKALDDLLPVYAPETWKKTSQDMWNDTKYNGKIYAIPSRYTEYIPHGFVYRGDYSKKYGIESISSMDDMEKYFDGVLKNENGIIPWDANINNASDLYKMFIESTSTWIPAPGLALSTMYLTAKSKDEINNIFHPAFTDEFYAFAEKMKNWADKGYWPQDVLSSKKDPVNSFNTGKGASFFQHAQGYIGWYGGLLKAQPNSDPKFYCFGEANKKVIKTNTMQNATAISANSKNPERSLMMIDLLMNDKEIYDLFQYGIKGRNYELDSNGKRITPENFDDKKNGYGQSAWAVRTDEFEIPMASDYKGRADMNKHYDTFAIKDPFANFNFNSKAVDSEIAAVNQVNVMYGVPILFGKSGDPKTAVENYRNKLKSAGIDKIIDEIKKQLQNYKPAQ